MEQIARLSSPARLLLGSLAISAVLTAAVTTGALARDGDGGSHGDQHSQGAEPGPRQPARPGSGTEQRR